MSNTNYPGAIDSPAYDPTTADTLASASHHTLHGFANDAILALETKLGAGASVASAGAFLVGTGANASAWTTTLVSPNISTTLDDVNNKTWIGQTAVASAVNYVNIANAATTGTPVISALGTDNNVSLNLVPKGSGKVQDNGSNLIDFRSSFSNFVQSGLVWAATTGLAAGMTSGQLWIGGTEYIVGAVATHTFGASVDTYVDYTVGTGLTYNPVANNAASPALASNSIRIAKVVTGASAVTSVVQWGVDTVTTAGVVNYIYNTSPFAAPVSVFTNSGNAGGVFYYKNQSGVKELWGATAGLAVSGSAPQSVAYTLTFPVGFFNAIIGCYGIASGTPGATQYTYLAPNTAPTTTSWVFYFTELSGASGTVSSASLYARGF